MAEGKGTGVTEVEVLRRWQGSAVQPQEKCGIPQALAEQLANLDPPAVRIIRHNVPATEGIDKEGVIGGDATRTRGDALIELVGELVQELRLARGPKKN